MLLAERPMHGYEMIQEIAERSGACGGPALGRFIRPCSYWSTKV
ncbi:padR family transcriptional regulator [Mycobacterium xenopi 3993]|nr:padR family transcriptional regulator [Mycobacterium xenopi 3993]